MNGLHGGDDIQLTQARGIVGVNHLHVFNPMTKRRQIFFLFVGA